VPGQLGLGSQQTPNAATVLNITDQRYGDYQTAINPQGGGHSGSNAKFWHNWNANYYSGSASVDTNFGIMNSIELAIDGGSNVYSNGYSNKTNWLAWNNNLWGWTPGQKIGTNLALSNYSTGDALALSAHVRCWGGYVANGDEGCELQDLQAYQGSVEYAGTLTGSPATGATSVTVSPTQGSGTQGAGRFLLDSTAGKTINAGTISAVALTSSAPTTVTGSGTAWPVTAAAATLGTSVTAPGSATVTPSSFTIGSISNITTSSLVCVYDAQAFEMVMPSAVVGATFTATFAKPHPSTALLATGGVCGYAVDFVADDVTNSTYTGLTQTITGTLHFAWPLVLSSSATSAQVWIAGGSGYGQYLGAWTVTNNTYVMYPMAVVSSVQLNGGVSDTLSLAPNNVSWAAGDTVFEAMYPAVHITGGNDILEKYYANFQGGTRYNLYMKGLWTTADRVMSANNATPTSLYTPAGGPFGAPSFIDLQGEFSYGMTLEQPPDAAAIQVRCPSGGCAATYDVVRGSNTPGWDAIRYDETNSRFSLTVNNRAKSYVFDSTLFTVPVQAAISNGLALQSSTKTTTYTATSTDVVTLCNAAGAGFSVMLPASPTTNEFHIVVKTDASTNTCTVDANGNYFGTGGHTVPLNGAYSFIAVQWTGIWTPVLGAPRTVATVMHGATPTFTISNYQPIQQITLAENETPTISVNGYIGPVTFHVCQNATGGFSFTWPANVHGATAIGTTLSKCNDQQFMSYDGMALYAVAAGLTNQ
jgi:hypothetical protein